MVSVEGWYPITLSASIDPGTSAGARLLGQELVVWRDNSGVAHVWEDRCPHRGMKLSFGFVRGDHIACLYHGWQYDTAGHCRYIPAHPDLDVPKTIKTNVFGAVEAAGMIWVGPSEGTGPSPALGDFGETLPVRSLYLDCNAGIASEALNAFAPPLFGSAGDAGYELLTAADGLLTLTNGADSLLIGMQPVSETAIAMHIAISGPPERYAGAGQLHFLAWANELRFRIESTSASAASQPSPAVA
jgi:nitrite reductase/ring-hydroxylating ferredoxin subunit